MNSSHSPATDPATGDIAGTTFDLVNHAKKLIKENKRLRVVIAALQQELVDEIDSQRPQVASGIQLCPAGQGDR
jgi:hypothetical protein